MSGWDKGDDVRRARRIGRSLGLFFEQSTEPAVVVGAGGAIVGANAAALLQSGYGLDELVGMCMGDLCVPTRASRALPASPRDHARHAYDASAIHLASERASQVDRVLLRRKDGDVVWVAPRATPVVIDGETVVVSVLQDVTACSAAYTAPALDATEGIWEAAVGRLGLAVALLDGERRAVRVNNTLGRWLEDAGPGIVGRRCDELFPSLCDEQPCVHALAARDGGAVVKEVLSPGGRPLRVEAWPAPANDAGIAIVHVAQDLSEEHAFRSRLVAADRLASLGRVAAGVAHEVNNPAGFVMLALRLAKDHAAHGRTGEALPLLDEALAAIFQIREAMRDLTGFARDQPRGFVDLEMLTNGAIRIASHEIQSRAHVERSFQPGIAAEAHGARIAQVLLNLLLNAAQAIAPGDPKTNRIDVSIRRAGERAEVEIADTGPGVPEAAARSLFEPFFTTRASTGGTGLGLWLSRWLVEEDGGSLTWRNRPGGGAAFTVSLPLVAEEPAIVRPTVDDAPSLVRPRVDEAPLSCRLDPPTPVTRMDDALPAGAHAAMARYM